jgi:hypothetical protein
VVQVGKMEQLERARAIQALTDYSIAATRAVDDWRAALAEQATQLAQFQAASGAAIEQARAVSESSLQKHKAELTELKSASAKDNDASAEWIAKHTQEAARAHDAQMVSAEEGKKTLVAQIGQLFAQFVTDSNNDLAKAGESLMAEVVKENKAVVALNVTAAKAVDTQLAAVASYRQETEAALAELSGSTTAKVSCDVGRIAEDTTRASLWSQSVENMLAESSTLSSKYGEHTTTKLSKARATNVAFSRQHGELSQQMLAQAQQSNEDLQGQLFYVSETCTNLNYAVESQTTEGKKTLDGWSARMDSDVTGMEDRFDNYYYSIKEYAPTGATPVKRALLVARELPVSMAAERVKEMYWENQLAEDQQQDAAVCSPVHVPSSSSSELSCTPVSASSAASVAHAILNASPSPVSERVMTPLANLSRAIETARLSLSAMQQPRSPVIEQPVFSEAVVVISPVVVAAPAAAPAPVVEEKEEPAPAPVAAAPVEAENKPANKKSAAPAKASKHPFVQSKKPDATLIKKLTVKDLKAYLQEEKLSDKGKKEELVERIVSHLTI